MKYRFPRGPAVVILTGILGVFLAGCGADSTPVTTGDSEELNLTDDFGGYKAADQPPGFGDPEIISTMAADEAALVFPGDSVEIDTLYGHPRFTLYTVAVRWGQLAGDSTITTVTDWSGTASLDGGHLKLTSIIRFERGQDSLVRPRPGPQELSWVSHTTIHFDGLAFMIIDPLYPDAEMPSAESFTFATEPYNRTFALDELADLDTVIAVDELGNQVAITAHRIELDPCGKGFFEGAWWPNNHLNKMGKFHGKWIAADGSLVGHLRGHWGERGNGERVLFGQWIDRSGVFKGFLRGTWEPDLHRPGHGFFRGTIFSRDKMEIGHFRGNYILPRNAHSRGFFQGGWKLHCPEESDG
jgi:hypothetical protein